MVRRFTDDIRAAREEIRECTTCFNLSDDTVYDMLTGIFENIDTIKASHNAADKNIYLEAGVSDLQLPLHPGAAAFWSEKGYTQGD